METETAKAVTHTPTPWEVYGPSVQGLTIKHGQLNVAFIPQELSSVDEANAAFIVRAVNSHEMMLRVLKQLSDVFKEGSSTYEMINEAIAKAEGD